MSEQNMNQHDGTPPLPPKRTGVPVVGSAIAFARDTYTFYADLASYGDVVRFSLGSYDMAAVPYPEGIKQVLVEDFDQFRKPDDAGGCGNAFRRIAPQ
jgi:hypothetical protein